MTALVSREMREVLIEHVDGPVAIDYSTRPVRADGRSYMSMTQARRNRSLTCLVEKGYLAFHRPGESGGPAIRPRLTWLTDAGREVLAALLADYADVLVRAQKCIPKVTSGGGAAGTRSAGVDKGAEAPHLACIGGGETVPPASEQEGDGHAAQGLSENL